MELGAQKHDEKIAKAFDFLADKPVTRAAIAGSVVVDEAESKASTVGLVTAATAQVLRLAESIASGKPVVLTALVPMLPGLSDEQIAGITDTVTETQKHVVALAQTFAESTDAGYLASLAHLLEVGSN